MLDPRSLLSEMKKSRAGEKQLQQELLTLKQREQRLQMHLAERDLETVDLRKQLHSARQAADPNIAQVRGLCGTRRRDCTVCHVKTGRPARGLL